MMPGKISQRVVTDRLAWIDRMLGEIRSLPMQSQSAFMADTRNILGRVGDGLSSEAYRDRGWIKNHQSELDETL